MALAAACRLPESSPPTGVAFTLNSKGEGPLLVGSKRAEARRSGNALVVNFANVAIARPQSDVHDVTLDTLYVRVYGQNHDLVGKSSKRTLGLKLTSNQPIADLFGLEFEVRNAAAICEKSCFVAAAAETSAGGIAESQAVELQLEAGKAVVSATPPDARDNQCAFTALKATQALGEPMKYATVDDNPCGLVPSQPGAKRFTVTLTKEENKTFNSLTQRVNAEMMAIGDRAVYVPPLGKTKAVVVAQRDAWTVTVTLLEKENSARETRARAETIARKITEKL